jgi:acetyltransferase-like isoleucine patch superfamily enzyme
VSAEPVSLEGDARAPAAGWIEVDGVPVHIGDGVELDMHVRVLSGDGGREPAPIWIGDGAWIGHGVAIMAGVRIGKHAVVGEGSVVWDDVPADAVFAGNPARPLLAVVR